MDDGVFAKVSKVGMTEYLEVEVLETGDEETTINTNYIFQVEL